MFRCLRRAATSTGAILLLLPAAASALPVRFAGPTHVTAGNTATAVASGDFNGDGDPDFVVANQLDDNVAVRLGGTGATFPIGLLLPVGNEPRAVTVASLDGDADPDLVVANILTDNVSVLRGSTGGTFLAKVDFAAGDGARAVAAGRFDGDSDTDLAVVNEHARTVSILSGQGGGGFSAPTHHAVGGSPSWAATGDFNRDGDLDLAVANLATDDVSVLRGAAGTAFAPAATFEAGDGPRSIVAADFNRDGDLDLAVANENSDDVTVLLGLAGASFSAPVKFPAGNAPRSVVAVDITRDGDLDLAVADTNDDAAAVLVGGAGAGFSPPVQFAAGNGPFGITTADFNADGERDLAVANLTSDDVSILTNTTPPDTAVRSGPAALTNDTTPTFGLSSDEPGSAFRCRVDLGTFAPCGAPFTTAALTDGAHSFHARAIDPAGNQDPTPATRGFTLDATAPETSIGGGPTGLTTATVASFGLSSNEPGSTFECRTDGAAFVPCTAPATVAVADGVHTFEARATDPAGNRDPSPASRSFTSDSAAPQTTIDGGPDASTTDLNPTFSFSASEPGSTFECRLGSQPFIPCSSPFTTARLARGKQRFEVRATDRAGNRDATPAERSFTALVRITAGIIHEWATGRGSTRVVRLIITAVPRGATVQARCRGADCPFTRKRVKASRAGRANVGRLFKNDDFMRRAVIEARVNARHAVGKVFRFRIRPSAVPPLRTLCLTPGAKRPGRC